ncbi:MAG: 2-amino-4-hydroxy-6-hydroxymethyldihydropteridine diphosphokinase [Bacteroidales bacterium]
MKGIYLGLGTNLGNREENLIQAVGKINEFIGPVINSSSVYETEPWGFMSEDKFLNMAVEVKTSLRPSGLLGRMLMIESMLGRLREGKQYSSRIIDIDILLYGKRKINRVSLRIPHPEMHKRRFVLVPLCEIAPDAIHPLFRKSIKTLLEECDDKCKVEKIRG